MSTNFVAGVRHLAHTIENGSSSFCEEHQRKVPIARFQRIEQLIYHIVIIVNFFFLESVYISV